MNSYTATPSVLSLVHEFFHDSTDFYCCLCSPPVLKLHNAGWHKWSLQFLDYLGEYKILSLFLPSLKLPKTHECHHGWKETTRKHSNKTQQKQKPPTPMGTCNGRSPHPAHCHMGRVSIQSK